jgi:hypothetical protein
LEATMATVPAIRPMLPLTMCSTNKVEKINWLINPFFCVVIVIDNTKLGCK